MKLRNTGFVNHKQERDVIETLTWSGQDYKLALGEEKDFPDEIALGLQYKHGGQGVRIVYEKDGDKLFPGKRG